MRIGILGGTFDPIHYGHLLICEKIREELMLDKVIFMPSGTPPHKRSIDVMPAEHRYNMVCKAIRSNAFFEASRFEMDRQGNTYTVDTLEKLKGIYSSDTQIFFIIGADVVMELLTWKSPEKVFQLCEFAAVMRPGYSKQGFENEIIFLRENYQAKINIITAPQIEISSTVIRDRVKENKSIRLMVPEAVEKYIIENKLYS